ncbi:DUF427 domain-containing protein [Paraburkholderia nemoris]|uniref:DUF427 domain-containing protein n=1 Tax=Paraburkholderia nemoris TaxID=2793076 RepID=UPI0038BC7703
MSDSLLHYDIFIEPSLRRVKVNFAGQTLVDTRDALLVHERGHVPVYYVPVHQVRDDLLHPSDTTTHSPHKGDARYWDLKYGEDWSENAVWRFTRPSTDVGERLKEYYAFDWRAVDVWYEEDEELFAHSHARDPYKRIDALASSRHVRVVVDDVVVADSCHPVAVFETGVPTLYYLPLQDVRTDLLEPTRTVTHCPYKGAARYWSISVGGKTRQDVVWSYSSPFTDMSKIAGLLAFLPERVDRFEVDGESLGVGDWNFSVLDYFNHGRFFGPKHTP